MTDTLEAFTAEEAADAGFFGIKADPTPDHAYTLAGVAAGEPTPETDAGAKQAAEARKAELADRFGGGSEAAPAAKSTKASSSSSS